MRGLPIVELRNKLSLTLPLLLILSYAPLSLVALKWEDLAVDPTYFYSQEYEDRGSVQEYIPSEHEDASTLSNPDKNESLSFIHVNEDSAIVVEFYAPWCPHCQRYRNHYIAMADEVQRRVYGEPNIMFYGLSCDSYRSLCEQYEIAGYPTIIGFKAGFRRGVDQPMELNGDAMPNLTADVIGKYLGLNLANEEPEILSMSSYSNSEDIRAKDERDEKAAIESARDKMSTYEYNKSYREIYLDAAKSLVFTIRQSIYISKGPLPETRRSALVEWLELLDWTLPEQFGIHLLITDLLVNIDILSSSSVKLLEILDRHADVSTWGVYLPKNIQDSQGNYNDESALMDSKKWSQGCSHGKRGAGYTCGLWELFHIMTIGVAERLEYVNGEGKRFSTEHAAQSLRNFVEHFFGCQVCRSHFVDTFDDCGADVCHRLSSAPSKLNSKQLSLWLWETHNNVNKRLISENAHRMGRHVFPIEEDASKWPMPKTCGSCWEKDGSFDDETVYLFLKKVYWPMDQTTASITFESIPDLFNDDENYKPVSSGVYEAFAKLIWIIPSIYLAYTTINQIMRQQELSNTGRHKKRDDSLHHSV